MSFNRKQQWLAEHKDKLDEIIPSKAEMKVQLKRDMKPAYLAVLKEQGNSQIADLAAMLPKANKKAEAEEDIEFDLNEPNVLKYIGDRLDDFSETTAQTTIDATRKLLREDFENGEPLLQMASHLREYYTGAETYRANLIARTESTSAMNTADLEAVRQMDLEGAVGKCWVSEQDPQTRETHLLASERYSDGYDGDTDKVMNIDDVFHVGNDQMLSPAGGQVAEENCNCRCAMVWEPIKEE